MFGRKKNDPLFESSPSRKSSPTRTYSDIKFIIEGMFAEHTAGQLTLKEHERHIKMEFYIGSDEVNESHARALARAMRASQDFENVVLIKKSDVKEELNF